MTKEMYNARSEMKLFTLSITVLLAFAGVVIAQQPGIPASPSNFKGNVRSIEYERAYARKNGRNVGDQRERISSESFDSKGRDLEYIQYGNGSTRTRYSYTDDRVMAEITYFDRYGNRTSETSPNFKPNYESVDETGLCAQYSIIEETDAAAKIERTWELCPDSTIRATTVDELDHADRIYRSTRTDAKSRSWIAATDYDSVGNVTEYRYTVSVGSRPTYTHTIRYSDHRIDAQGNWIRMTATAFISTRPGELIYQYNEIRSITYFSDPAPGTGPVKP